MFEYIQFYTKNLTNFTILLLIGVIIAILDITLRNVIKDVYLNVRENMRGSIGDNVLEGMENKGDKGDKGDTGDKGDSGGKGDTGNTGPAGPSIFADLKVKNAIADGAQGVVIPKWHAPGGYAAVLLFRDADNAPIQMSLTSVDIDQEIGLSLFNPQQQPPLTSKNVTLRVDNSINHYVESTVSIIFVPPASTTEPPPVFANLQAENTTVYYNSMTGSISTKVIPTWNAPGYSAVLRFLDSVEIPDEMELTSNDNGAISGISNLFNVSESMLSKPQFRNVTLRIQNALGYHVEDSVGITYQPPLE